MDIRVAGIIQTTKLTDANQIQDGDLQVLHATGFDVKPEVNKIESKVLGAGRWTKDTVPGKLSVAGDVPLEPSIDELCMFLEAGGFKKINGSYKSGAFEKYMTLVSDFPSDNMCLQYYNCLVNTLEINAQQEAYVTMKAGIIGMANNVREHCLKSVSSKSTGDSILCFGATLYETDSTDTDKSAEVQGVTININNSLEGRGGLNTKFNTKILQNGRGSIELTVEFNSFDKENYLKAMKLLTNNEALKMKLKLAETENKFVEIIMPKIKLTNVDLGDLEGAGTITRTFAVLPDETGQPIEFKITDNKTTGVVS